MCVLNLATVLKYLVKYMDNSFYVLFLSYISIYGNFPVAVFTDYLLLFLRTPKECTQVFHVFFTVSIDFSVHSDVLNKIANNFHLNSQQFSVCTCNGGWKWDSGLVWFENKLIARNGFELLVYFKALSSTFSTCFQRMSLGNFRTFDAYMSV